LFQVLKDDFLSLFVRACWLVSFFFTPIYMFILTFVVMFGAKKGVFTTYYLFWNYKYFNLNQILLNFQELKINNTKLLNFYLLHRFQFTLFTCRTTIYILFSFWLFFFFFGESLLLILFNFTTLTDSISSHSFFIFKSHILFFLNTSSVYLSNTIMFYIIFFTTCSFIFLLNLRYTFNYFYLKNLWFFDFIFFFVFLTLFVNKLFCFLLILYFFKK
jgi:hypothetical protein